MRSCRLFAVAGLLTTLVVLTSSGCWTGPPPSGRWASDDVDGMAVSPDGATIVFVGNDGRGGREGLNGSDLFLLDLATKKVRRLTDTPEMERQPCFSHSGKLIAYTAGASWYYPPRSLYVRSLDGKFVKRLTNGGNTRRDLNPSFSSDDEQITFAGATSAANGQHIYTIGLDGRNLRRVTRGLGFHCKQSPHFYRNDTTLLFETYQSPDDPFGEYPPGVISKCDVTTGAWQEKIRLGQSSNATANITVSPDGRAIAFTSDYPRQYDYDVFYAPSLDAPPRSLNVARRGHGPRCLYVVPSQKTVYFIQNDLQLWRVGLDGSNLVRIADTSLFDDPLHWKP